MNQLPTGFMGFSQRKGKTPVVAAVNGFVLGGEFEICLNGVGGNAKATVAVLMCSDLSVIK
jgi:hypothetical protein